MIEKIKTGLCVIALLLALLAAYQQEMAFRRGLDMPPAVPYSTVMPVG